MFTEFIEYEPFSEIMISEYRESMSIDFPSDNTSLVSLSPGLSSTAAIYSSIVGNFVVSSYRSLNSRTETQATAAAQAATVATLHVLE